MSLGSPGLNPQCRDVTRPWAHECRALLPPHSSPFCQDERPLPSSPANRQFLKNLLCPLPFSLLSFRKARWETSCGHSWQTISDIALSQKPAVGQYWHFPLSSGSLTTLLWVEYFTKNAWVIDYPTAAICSGPSTIHHITPKLLSTWSPYCRNLLWVFKNTLPNLHVHWSLHCRNLLWAIKNTSPTLHVHWPPYHRNLFWAIKNTPCRSIYSTIDHPITATCYGQSITKIPSPSTPSVTTLLQKSAPGHWIKKTQILLSTCTYSPSAPCCKSMLRATD